MKDPLLQGSAAALPGTSLQKACRLLVLFCALHLAVTLVYYVSGGIESNFLQYFSEHQQHQNSDKNFTAGARGDNMSTQRVRDMAESGSHSTVTASFTHTQTSTVLPPCPDKSPLLGKSSVCLPSWASVCCYVCILLGGFLCHTCAIHVISPP